MTGTGKDCTDTTCGECVIGYEGTQCDKCQDGFVISYRRSGVILCHG